MSSASSAGKTRHHPSNLDRRAKNQCRFGVEPMSAGFRVPGEVRSQRRTAVGSLGDGPADSGSAISRKAHVSIRRHWEDSRGERATFRTGAHTELRIANNRDSRAPAVAGSPKLPAGTRPNADLRDVWSPSGARQQRFARDLVGSSATPGVDGPSDRRSRNGTDNGRRQRATPPYRRHARRVEAGAWRGDHRESGCRGDRRDRLAAHPRRVSPDRDCARSIERRRHRFVCGVVVGPSTRPSSPWNGGDRAGLWPDRGKRLLGWCAGVWVWLSVSIGRVRDWRSTTGHRRCR